MADVSTAYRTCPLCEATCGLELTMAGDTVEAIRGDEQDVFSHGFICPKGFALKELDQDPDRLRTPLVRGTNGELEPASWEEAFAAVESGLCGVLERGGRDAVGTYLGNPSAHNLASILYGRVLLKAIGSRNIFSASTVDQMPKQVVGALMFGTGTSVPVPDVDRTDYLVMLGANPLASNGSLMTAPDMRGRLRRLRERGGRLVVIDPRRSRTAEEADEHHFIRPGTDALLLFAMVNALDEESLVDAGEHLSEHLDGLDEALELARPFTPERVADHCGIEAEVIRRLARDLAAADRAAVYGRIGTCTQEFGTLSSWLVDVLNTATGNLDRDGGAMFPRAAAGARNAVGEPGRGRGAVFGRWQSRVRGCDEVFGELPAVCMAEEMETPGDGQMRALLTIAGNPVLSTPNGARLNRALESLDFMVSVDIYVNETTRHADVILPVPGPLERAHYDIALYQFAVHNVANYSPPTIAPRDDIPDEWRTLLRLAGVAGGQGADVDVDALDDFVAREVASREVALPGSPVEGRPVEEVLAAVEPRRGPERLLDLMLRAGPYGDGFGTRPDGLTLGVLEESPHGVDLGALEPRIPEVLRTASGRIEMAPERIVADVPRLEAALERPSNGRIVLVGRRQLRSNNSWMHNLPVLVKGKPRCTLHVHPRDGERLGLADGDDALVRSEAGEVRVPVELTDGIMPGVVSIPHGWGHDMAGVHMSVAEEHAGVNANLLTGAEAIDEPSGNAVLNGVAVEVVPAEALAASVPAP